MPPKKTPQLTLKEIESLLNQQTIVILGAVDDKLRRTEEKINQKIDRLVTTMDRFLKKLDNLDDEFALIKSDLKRVKAVLREKLGVILD